MPELNYRCAHAEHIYCPFCDHAYSPIAGIDWEHSDEQELTCPECEAKFLAQRFLIPCYRSFPKACKPYEHKIKLTHAPYLYEGRVWTAWHCEHCWAQIIKTSPYSGETPYTLYPTLEECKNPYHVWRH